jgi:hypothetical protein
MVIPCFHVITPTKLAELDAKLSPGNPKSFMKACQSKQKPKGTPIDSHSDRLKRYFRKTVSQTHGKWLIY